MTEAQTTERRPTSIEVLEVRRIEDAGNLKAFAKVRLGAVVIHGCRIVQQPGQRPWVSLPQQPTRQKADGSGAGWYPVVEILNADLLTRVRAAVLDAWQAKEQRVARELASAADDGALVDLLRLGRGPDRALLGDALREAIAGQHQSAAIFDHYAAERRAVARQLEALRPLAKRSGLRLIEGGRS